MSRVLIIKDDRFLGHETGLVHPEHPNRLRAIHQMLDGEFAEGLPAVEAEPATLSDLEAVHTPAHLARLMITTRHPFTYLAPDTPAGPKSCLAAWLAAGGCLKLLDTLLAGDYQSGFALVRPPGHHALPDRASGFCLLNNLGVVAQKAVDGYGLERVLIVDWDIHHGNGLQQMFYRRQEVLYFSTHYLSSFPQTGAWEEVGDGPGRGYTVNIPLPKNLEDDDIVHGYREVLGPIFRRYRPQLVLVAAGFDAHHLDPLGRTKLTERAFGRLTAMLKAFGQEIGGRPILLALEGGYDLKGLTSSVKEVLTALIADGRDLDGFDRRTERGERLVAEARRIHGQYGIWTD